MDQTGSVWVVLGLLSVTHTKGDAPTWLQTGAVTCLYASFTVFNMNDLNLPVFPFIAVQLLPGFEFSFSN